MTYIYLIITIDFNEADIELHTNKKSALKRMAELRKEMRDEHDEAWDPGGGFRAECYRLIYQSDKKKLCEQITNFRLLGKNLDQIF